MASSPIEIASAPYHDVLRTHDRRIRDRDRECSSKKRFVVKKNINELVRDHLHNCWGENSSHSFGLDESKRGETRILDRWAAHQAKEMISTLDRQTHQAELLALSNSQSVSERASTFLRETSPSPSDSSVAEVPNLRASSLVQMWKEFEAEATTPRGCQNANSNARYKTTVSNVTENASVGESPVGSERDFRFDTFMEWDPEQIPSSEQQQHLPSFQRQSSDASEGNKVADIVKRLTSAGKTCNEIDQEQPEPTSSSHNVPHLVEPMDFKINRKRLRLRGRQATKDLYMQMEHERRLELNKLAERRPVAQFPQRGRIQALIRLKFLQREAMVQNQQRPASTSSELNQLHGKSTIFRLREKFNTRDKHINAGDVHNLNEDRLQQNCARSQTVIQDSGHEQALNEDNLETHTRSLNAALDSCNVPILNEDRFQTLDATKDDTGLFDHLTSQDAYSNSITTFEDNERTVTVDNSTSAQNEHDSLPSTSDSCGQAEHHSDPSTSKKHTPRSICMENVGSVGPMNNESTSHGWEGVIITEELVLDAMDRWEMLNAEPESNTLDQGDGSWFNNASCPPRDWECTRQTWYNENGSDNEEIDGLLDKRTVSNLLASSFRERMDRLLLSRLKKHPEIFGNAEEEEFIGHPYQEVPIQLPLPSNSRPWNQYPDQETSDSDRAAYTSLGTPQPFSSDSHHFSPFTNHQSLEMEFLYELKGHVERLQYEMSEMRETLKSCMGMQMMLQNSISQEVAAAVCRSMNAIRGETSNTIPKKRLNCCICCSTQVDSFLYRCGHMCTCFKCAHELQYSSSRCPICRAPILDVVRAYPDP